MKFYLFDQNNSGGHMVIEEDRGIGSAVVIEAENEKAAEDRAETVGVYFDGVSADRDCPCCGDRWYRHPEEYDTYVDLLRSLEEHYKWMFNYGPMFVHLSNGTIDKIILTNSSKKSIVITAMLLDK